MLELLEVLGVIFFSAIILAFPLFLVYSGVKWVWELAVTPKGVIVAGQSGRQIRVDQREIEQILSAKFQYYRKLQPADQEKFLKRTARFILNKEFRAMRMELTEEMVVLISASAIQLTFGLQEYLLDHFSRIFIYPKEFHSRAGKRVHKGETNLAGAIVLSWKHFREGYENSSDNINLGLHEMAHALKFDKLKSSEPDKSFAEYLDKWMMISKEEFLKLRNKQGSDLREYGGSNSAEFLSVCVEYFFESPLEFKKSLPEIYKHMCILLNQDPAAGTIGGGVSRRVEQQVDNTTALFECHNHGANRIMVIVNLVIGILMLSFIMRQENSDFKNSWSFWFFILIFTAMSVYQLVIKKKKIVFYQSGMALRSAISGKLDKLLNYDDIASIRFYKNSKTREDEPSSVTILSMKDGRIRKSSHHFIFANDAEAAKAVDFLTEKNIPVRIAGYAVLVKTQPIYQR